MKTKLILTLGILFGGLLWLVPTIYGAAGDLDTTFSGDGKAFESLSSGGNDQILDTAIQTDGKIVTVGMATFGSSTQCSAARFNADGSPDTTFDGDGKVITPIGSISLCYAVAIQADGKIVAAGYSDNGTNNDLAVVRYNTDGSLDTSFGTGGKLTTPIGTSHDIAYAVAIQADGKIVAAGSSRISSTTLDIYFALVRYNTDGSLDTSFDSDGKLTTPIGTGNGVANAVAIQADGKIVAAGYGYNGTNNDFAVARYNTDGSLDTSFDSDGKLTTPIGASTDVASAVAIQADGKIVAAGSGNNGTNNDFAVARYNTNGSLDTSFDSDGKLMTPIGFSDERAYAVAIQADGKIVAAGSGNNGTNDDFAVARYNTNGSLDASFGNGGTMTTWIGTSHDIANAVAIQADGKIVAAGYGLGTNQDFALVRYNTNGLLDAFFDSDGKVTRDIGGGVSIARAVAIQADGKIVAAGYGIGANQDFALVRYNTDGSLDTSFGTGGKVTTPIGTGSDIAYAVAIQADGKIVAAGYGYNGTNDDFAVARYNTNGSLDTSFGTGGKVTTQIDFSDERAYAVAIQADGKIVAAGSSLGTNNNFALVRYNTNGSLDTSFDSDGKLTTPVGATSICYAIAIQADGKIVAAGSSRFNLTAPFDFAVVKYNPNGSLNGSFNDGIVTTPIGTSDDQAYAVAIQADGKIVAAGYGYNGSINDIALVRYNTNGLLDTSFGTGGKLTTPIGTGGGVANAVAIQADGKIVAAGYGFVTNGYDFALVRYNTNGSLDNSFWNPEANLYGVGGKVTFDILGRNDIAYAAALDSFGRAVVVGEANGNFAVARVLGSLAPTAAKVSVSGRVLTSDGRGLRNAVVYLTKANGETLAARTSSFGYYRFNDIEAGQTVVVAVSSKRFQFNPQVVSIADNIADLDFTAQSGKGLK